ncbi:Vitamin B12 import ATP-binding protein BtuD [Streptomyces alboniger]
MQTLVRQRLMLLRTLRRVGGIVLTAGIVLRAIQSLVPVGIALTMSALIQRLSDADAAGWQTAAAPLIALGTAVLASRVVPELLAPLTFLAEQRIDGSQREELTRLVTSSSSLDVLERRRVQKLIRLARADREFWSERTPGQGAMAQLDLLFTYAGVAASCAALTVFAWWLVPLIVVPTIAARSVQRRQFLEHVRLEAEGTLEGMRADNWKRLATQWTGGKEVRAFGLATWAADQANRSITAKFAPTWASATASAVRQWKIIAIVGPPLALAYSLVAWNAARGVDSVAAAAAVFSASWSMLTMLGFADVVLIEGAIPGVTAFEKLASETRSTEPVASPPLRETPADDGSPPLVRFEKVSFVYPGTDRPILHSIDLEIRPGELLAVVGLNGAGKSTLIKLLTGLYRPTSGRITADGTDIADLGAAAWRHRVCAVFQDFIQYQLPVADNIVMGRAMIPPQVAAMRAAAQDAGLTSIVEGLPKGWDTPLSRARSGGVDLSGGQWQQVVLTRALYGLRTGARLAVFDEPTAHMDVRTEAQVFDCLARYHGDRSVVLISHRLSTVRRANRIVFLHDGRITENGSHDELIGQGGRYAQMFAIQAERFQRGYDDRQEKGDAQ